MAIVNSVSPSIAKDPGYYGKTVAHSDLVKFGIDGTRHMAKQGVSTVEGSVIHAANMADVSAVSATDGRPTSTVLVYRTSDRDAADVCSFCLVDRESGQVITAGPSFSHVDRFNRHISGRECHEYDLCWLLGQWHVPFPTSGNDLLR